MDKTSGQHLFWVLAGIIAVIIAAFCVYWPAMTAGFVWDDDTYVTGNPLLYEKDGLKRIWFSVDQTSQYFPLVYTTFRIEYSLWQLDPFGYHLNNIILHTINSLLLWLLLSRLGFKGGFLAAMVFALHPVHVESVAWITERKNVLVAFFSFLSLLAWTSFAEKPDSEKSVWPIYVLSLLLYMLALFSKTTACTLGAGLVLILWIKHIKLDLKRWLQIGPYIILGLAMGLLAVWWEGGHQGTDAIKLELSFMDSILIASRAVWFYLGKLIWPTNLTFSYPAWNIDPSEPLQYIWVGACCVSAGALWYWRNRISRYIIFAAVFFVATLLPMLGFFRLFTFAYTYVADHYQYVASIGPIALVTLGAYYFVNRFGARLKTFASVFTVLVFITLGALTYQQCHVYQDIETLWRDTIKKNPSSKMANYNLGRELSLKGRYLEATGYFQNVLKVDPDDIGSHNNLGAALGSIGRNEEAIKHFRKVLEIYPNHIKANINLALVYLKQGRYDEAEPLLVKAHEMRRRELGQEHPDTLRSVRELVKFYEVWGKPQKAEEWRGKLVW